MLFHISEEPQIKRFEPRPSNYTPEPVVWAVSGDRLYNYLLPRNCPRVTYYAGATTTSDDVKRFLKSCSAVVAVESGWLEEIRSCRLYAYHLPSETFECIDDCAGYFVSRVTVEPTRVEIFDDLLSEFSKRGVELRFLPNLWELRNNVVESSLQFSLIRMRNARPVN